MTQESINKIGYYKYETSNEGLLDLACEYPITEEILNYIKNMGNVKIEFEGNNPKLINGKLIILI